MRKSIVITIAATLFAIAGCGGSSSDTPVACREGADVYLKALENAPRPVKLRGETLISDCLPENQSGGDLSTVGAAMVTAATQLSAEARSDPGGSANVQLGYLLGAAQRGGERTNGIHSVLLNRLSAAVSYSRDDKALPLSFVRAITRGAEAGKTSG